MTKAAANHPAIAPPLLIIVAGEKGGVGKSLTSLVLADTFQLNDFPLDVLQIDNQARLSQALGRNVSTIRIDAKLARRDPAAASRAYTPIYAAVEAISSGQGSVLVDVGANEGEGLAQWLGLVDLAGDLEEWSIPVLVVIPFVAESEAIRQAGRTAQLFLDRLPSAQLVLIENERDGRISDLHPASDAARSFTREISPLKRIVRVIRMPLIEAGSWRPFEAASCRLIDVAAMPVDKVMEVTGLPRAEAKIVRGDVAAFFAQMLENFSGVIGFETEVTS
ncbi:MAG: hypothetical protein AB7V13_08275 [Pseudorhodoplanes sp.]